MKYEDIFLITTEKSVLLLWIKYVTFLFEDHLKLH